MSEQPTNVYRFEDYQHQNIDGAVEMNDETDVLLHTSDLPPKRDIVSAEQPYSAPTPEVTEAEMRIRKTHEISMLLPKLSAIRKQALDAEDAA